MSPLRANVTYKVEGEGTELRELWVFGDRFSGGWTEGASPDAEIDRKSVV